jgi:hypothetical protein
MNINIIFLVLLMNLGIDVVKWELVEDAQVMNLYQVQHQK